MSSLPYPHALSLLKAKRRPLAYIDLGAFDRNLEALVTRSGSLPLRIASKSVRSVELLKRALRHPQTSGVLAYSGWEAVELSKRGIADIVLGYPIISQVEIRSVLEANAAGASITFMADTHEHLVRIAKESESLRMEFAPIAIDLDLSSRWPGIYFGVHRSSISTLAALESFLKMIRTYPRLKLVGAMGYEAQIAGVSDRSLFLRALKKLSLRDVHHFRKEAVALILSHGHVLRFVNGGGTGSLESTRQDSSVTEVTAGSGLFSPTLFDHYHHFRHNPAAAFILEVTRKPEPEIATCFSGGFIASGASGTEKLPKPVYPTELHLLTHEGAGEVQTPVAGSGAHSLKVGDSVIFRHAKAGELLERFNDVYLLNVNEIEAVVPTYRGEGWNFG